VGILPTFAALGSLWMALGILLGFRARKRSWVFSGISAAAAAMITTVVASGPLAAGRVNPFENLTRPYPPGAKVLAYREGAESTVTVVEVGAHHRVLRINGFEAAGFRENAYIYMQLMADLPLLLHPNPQDALVISYGTGATAGAAARHPLRALDLVDLDPAVFGMADHFAAVNRQVLRDPRARAIVNDGRNFLVVTNRRYDVITLEPMPPTFAGMVNLYSREFYTLARSRLRPGGIMCQWVPFQLMSLAESLEVLRTFHEVFPDSTLWIYAGTGFIIGKAGEGLIIDGTRLTAALKAPGVGEDLARGDLEDPLYLLNLLAWDRETLRAATTQAAVITDDHPSIEFPELPFRYDPRKRAGVVRLMRSLQFVYDRRRLRPPPVTNLPPAVASVLAEYRESYDHTMLGTAAWELNQPRMAEAAFRAGLSACLRDACRAQFALHLGLLAERRGDRRAARRYLREADRLVPGLPEVREGLRRLGGDTLP